MDEQDSPLAYEDVLAEFQMRFNNLRAEARLAELEGRSEDAARLRSEAENVRLEAQFA